MFTAYSACPTTEYPACVPGTYYVQRPAALRPVGRVGGICRLSQAAACATEARTRLAHRPA